MRKNVSPIVSSARTRIYPMSLADASFMLELTNTPGWINYIGKRDLTDVAAAKVYLSNGFLKIQDELGFGYYVVKNLSDEDIGVVGFLKKEELEHEDFGFAFMPEWHGQGYAYEASKAILDYGCNEFNFSVLDAVTLADNIPSQKLLLKLGFKDTGLTINDNKEEIVFRRTSKTE